MKKIEPPKLLWLCDVVDEFDENGLGTAFRVMTVFAIIMGIGLISSLFIVLGPIEIHTPSEVLAIFIGAYKGVMNIFQIYFLLCYILSFIFYLKNHHMPIKKWRTYTAKTILLFTIHIVESIFLAENIFSAIPYLLFNVLHMFLTMSLLEETFN